MKQLNPVFVGVTIGLFIMAMAVMSHTERHLINRIKASEEAYQKGPVRVFSFQFRGKRWECRSYPMGGEQS